MKKNLFIFAVSIMTTVGVAGAARAEIAAMDYVDQQVAGKLNANLGPLNQNKALVTDSAGKVIPGEIAEEHLATGIKDKINNALTKISATTTIDDKAITVAKLNGGTGNTSKVLTVDAAGGISPQFVSIPVGQTGNGGTATIWIEQ